MVHIDREWLSSLPDLLLVAIINTERDWLSSLPDLLLVAIISLLPFKEAARTSVLTKRWLSVWWATKNVEFDERSFVKRTEGSSEIVKGSQRRVFVDYLRKWIGNYHGPGAEKFRLAFSHPEDHLSEMDKYIRFATHYKVKMLDLDFTDPLWSEETVETHETFLQLPSYEGHEMLESLKLYSCNLPLVSGFNTFSALKSISLGWISLASCAIIELLSKCPALEVLSFKKCWSIGYFEVTAPNLTTLIIDKCFPPGPDMIIVTAPKLRSFKYSGALTVFDFKYFKAIEEAELDFGLEKEYVEHGDMLYNMLVEVSSAKTLTVCSFMLQVITSGEEPLSLKPALENVRHLILKTALHGNEFYGITFFLQSCPRLELLTIDLLPATIFPDYEPPFNIEEHEFVGNFYPQKPSLYKCVRQSLSRVVVKGFKGLPNEVSVLAYFLRHGSVLDTLRIGISVKEGADMEATYKEKALSLLGFRRSSDQTVEVFSSL